MWFHCIYLHLSRGVCLHHRQFSSCSHLPHHQPPVRTGRISHRLSPAWTWSQRQPHAATYVQLFLYLMGSKMSCCPEQGTRSLWPVAQGPRAPFSSRFLPQPSCGCQLFLLTVSPPDHGYPLCLEMSSFLTHPPRYTHTCPLSCSNSLAIGSIW